MEEKIKELETELSRVNEALRNSETENGQLKEQVKKMTEGEASLRMQLTSLQESLEIISSKHKELESVKDDTSYQAQEYEDKISELKTILNESSIAQSELEAERELLTGKVAEHERRTKATTESSIELRGLMQRSYSRVEDSNRRVSEFEKVLEAEKEKIGEFEKEMETLEEKYERAETEKQKYSDLVTQLSAELEQSSKKVSSYKNALEEANRKEKISGEELEDKIEKLKEDEGLIGVLSNELNETRGKLESNEKEKKKSFDKKLQSFSESFKGKDNDVQSLHEKLELLKDQMKLYREQTAEGSRKSEGLKADLEKTKETVKVLEASNEEMKRLRDESESKVDELRKRLEGDGAEKGDDRLREELSAILADKDDVVRQLNSSKKKTDDLTQELSLEDEQSLVTKLEGEVKEYRRVNESLRDELEKLSLEADQNSVEGTSARDLEEKLKVVEADKNKEVEDVLTSATAREAVLSGRLKQKKEEITKLAIAKESAIKHESEEIETKSQQVKMLEEQVKELQQKLQKTRATHTGVKMVIGVAFAAIIIGLVLGPNFLD